MISSWRAQTHPSSARRLVAGITALIVGIAALATTASAAENEPKVTLKLVDNLVITSIRDFPKSVDLSVRAAVTGGAGSSTLKTNDKGRVLLAFELPDGFSGDVTVTASAGSDSVTATLNTSATPVSAPATSASTPSTVAPTSTTPPPTMGPTTSTTKVVAPTPTTAKPVGTSGSLLFVDEFDGAAESAPDPTKWVNYGSWCKTPEGVTVHQPGFGFISCDAKKYLDGKGNLVLPASPQQGSGVQTATKFGFVYGEASAWMKMPKEVGYWPAFWTLNNLESEGKGLIGEADVVEYYSTWPDYYHTVTHSHNSTPKTAAKPGGTDNFCKVDFDLTADFHKYTARFEPGKITYSLDGKVCGVEVADTFTQWGFGPNNMTNNWLILNNAIGGAGGQQKPATQNSEVLVSRVEVRAL